MDVAHLARVPKIEACSSCKTAVELSPSRCDLGGYYWTKKGAK